MLYVGKNKNLVKLQRRRGPYCGLEKYFGQWSFFPYKYLYSKIFSLIGIVLFYKTVLFYKIV